MRRTRSPSSPPTPIREGQPAGKLTPSAGVMPRGPDASQPDGCQHRNNGHIHNFEVGRRQVSIFSDSHKPLILTTPPPSSCR